MSETPTPRTDAEVRWTCGCDEAFQCVEADFARDLEREITRLRKALTEVSMCPNILRAHYIAIQALHLPCTDAGCERCCG